MDALLEVIAEELLRADAKIATRRIKVAKLYQSNIFHWISVGDTTLHLSVADYRVEILRRLFAAVANRARKD